MSGDDFEQIRFLSDDAEIKTGTTSETAKITEIDITKPEDIGSLDSVESTAIDGEIHIEGTIELEPGQHISGLATYHGHTDIPDGGGCMETAEQMAQNRESQTTDRSRDCSDCHGGDTSVDGTTPVTNGPSSVSTDDDCALGRAFLLGLYAGVSLSHTCGAVSDN